MKMLRKINFAINIYIHWQIIETGFFTEIDLI